MVTAYTGENGSGLGDQTPASSTTIVDTTSPVATITGQPTDPSTSQSPAFTFSSPDATATFECSVDAAEFASCQSGAAISEVLADGEHTFRVRGVDPLLNTGVADSYTWEVDHTKPVVTLNTGPASGGFSNARKPVWTFGIADANLDAPTHRCKVDSQAWVNNCLAPFQPASNLSDGSHTLTIEATDTLGQTETFSFSFTVDTIAPAVSIDGPESPSGPAVSVDFSSEDANASFRCRVVGTDAFAWRDCSATEQLTGLSSGSRTVQAKAIDRAGNESEIESFSWATVGGVPETTIGSDNVGSSTSRRSASFSFSSSHALATFSCKLDDGAWAACTSIKTHAGLSLGAHTFSVRAANEVGTVDQSPATRSWTVVAADGPETTLRSTPDSPTRETTARFGITSSDPLARFECKLDAGAWGSCASPVNYSNLAVGSHTFQARAIDEGENVDASPASHTWEVAAIPAVCSPVTAVAKSSAMMALAPGLKVGIKASAQSVRAGSPVGFSLLTQGNATKVKAEISSIAILKPGGSPAATLKASSWAASFTPTVSGSTTLTVVINRKKGTALRTTIVLSVQPRCAA